MIFLEQKKFYFTFKKSLAGCFYACIKPSDTSPSMFLIIKIQVLTPCLPFYLRFSVLSLYKPLSLDNSALRASTTSELIDKVLEKK